MRFRSSSRCSRKLIDAIRSFSISGGSSVLVSGIGGFGRGVELAGNRPAFLRRWRIRKRLRGYHPGRGRRRQDLLVLFSLLLPFLILNLADLRFDLRLEFLR